MSEASPTVKGRICFCNSYLFFPVYISFSFTNKKIREDILLSSDLQPGKLRLPQERKLIGTPCTKQNMQYKEIQCLLFM